MLYKGVNRVLGFLGIVFVQESLDAGPVVRMDVSEVLDRFLLDEKLCVFQMAGNVLTQASPLFFIQYVRIECPHLSDVIIIGTVVAPHVPRRGDAMFQGILLLLLGSTEAVGVVIGGTTLVVEHAHGAVTLVVGHSSTVGTVYRYLKIVGSQAVAVSVRIGKKATLKHFVRAGFNARGHVAWVKGQLFNFSKVIHWIPIQDHFTNWDKRIVLVRPNLGNIKGIK